MFVRMLNRYFHRKLFEFEQSKSVLDACIFPTLILTLYLSQVSLKLNFTDAEDLVKIKREQGKTKNL